MVKNAPVSRNCCCWARLPTTGHLGIGVFSTVGHWGSLFKDSRYENNCILQLPLIPDFQAATLGCLFAVGSSTEVPPVPALCC